MFAEALEREGEARNRFLDETCAGDPSLRHEVETMLQAARASEEFLETPVFDVAAGLLGDDTVRVQPVSGTAGSRPFSHTGSIDNARFVPGDIVADRYRIVGLLGRGGMGEVYRADDLRLTQPVALKFLAESLARDRAALDRFRREVSVTRQISHRHVCRVYDIGEHAGMQFLSMEYIRGEELSSLLKRIGRLPHDKAIDVARQLCAGLAAIHDAGVLHRDLKPANIMLDEHGDVRITDFGIVALSEGVSGREAMIGTPAYMSPEQRTGGELTTRSDLYSLGLVLHEFFTGKRRNASPTTTAVELDPAIERVIARCLESDPGKRPASALQVAAALPGGDPLAAALAAGETPSPEMVAAAPKEGSLRPATAVLLLSSIVAAVLFVTLVSGRTMLHRFLPLERSAELLQESAANLARTAGYAAPGDAEWGFDYDDDAFAHASADRSPKRWERLRSGVPAVLSFWYRQSPHPLVARNAWFIDPVDPPATLSGMVQMRLDPQGRLTYFEAVPPQVEKGATATADWRPFFAAARLDPAALRRTEPQWTPPHHSDARVAWSGTYPGRPDLPLRIEAASYRGKPVYFDVIGPWRSPARESAPPGGSLALSVLAFGLYFGALALAVLLAWKNVRKGRGDRAGALRLALFMFVARMIVWIVFAHHTPTGDEVSGFVTAVQSALYWGASIGLLHLALEPFVRRRWPEWLISWSRLLAGSVRDPLVGRDLLIGCAFGGAVVVAGQLHPLLAALFGLHVEIPRPTSPILAVFGFLGPRGFVVQVINQLSASFLFSFVIIAILLFFAMVTRNKRIAIVVTWLLFSLFMGLLRGGGAIGFPLAVVVPSLLLLVLTRHGVLALIAAIFVMHLGVFYPITTELSAWYATSFILELIVVAAVALYGFKTSLAGQRLAAAGLFDE
ncbi:MAG TPA: serine/threonine-protein kinase [Thermoanaerobaculia bacterium]